MNKDEAMCGGYGCPLRESCRRYLEGIGVVSGYWVVAKYEDGKCEFYVKGQKEETK